MDPIKYGKTRKNIISTLRSKIQDWSESIVDESVKKIVLNNSIVTGGCIASMLMGEKVNDFDVYFKDHFSALKVAEYYANQWNSTHPENQVSVDFDEIEKRVKMFIKSTGIVGEQPVQPEEDEESSCEKVENSDSEMNYVPVFISANAITLSDRIQIVIRFYGEPNEIHKNFDFAHATCSYDPKNDNLIFPEAALLSILSRTLIYNGSLYPIASIFRMKKFMNRGWKVSAGTMLKIMWQISELNMRNISVLEEQLTGVDQTYMRHLVETLKTRDPESINSTYVSAIIDKIFGT